MRKYFINILEPLKLKKINNEKQMIILFSLIVAATAAAVTRCNANDKLIHRRIGHTFEKRFRNYGGLTVSEAQYVNKIVKRTGLSKPCAQCYGAAYICGWNNCKTACITASSYCTECLTKAKCISRCKKCIK